MYSTSISYVQIHLLVISCHLPRQVLGRDVQILNDSLFRFSCLLEPDIAVDVATYIMLHLVRLLCERNNNDDNVLMFDDGYDEIVTMTDHDLHLGIYKM